MKKEKTSAKVFYISAVCMYIVAFTNFFGNDYTTCGVIYLVLGTCNLCFGCICMRTKKRKDNEE